MKKIKVEIGEPFQVKVTLNQTDFFKQTLKITSIKGEKLIPEKGKSRFIMEAVIEQGDYMYIEKRK